MSRAVCAALIAAGTGIAGPVLAVDVTGGSVALSYSGFTEGGRTDADRKSVAASAEVEVTRLFAVQGDLAFHGFGLSDGGGQGLALHGIVHATPDLSVGLFAGVESLGERDADFAGVEAVLEFHEGTAEAYFAKGQVDGTDGHAIGLAGEYFANHWLSFTATSQSADFGRGLEAGRTAIGARVALGPVDLTAEYGRGRADFGAFDEAGAFASFGASYTFGFMGGATFEGRGLGGLVPGL
jgi:hypothetical protein